MPRQQRPDPVRLHLRCRFGSHSRHLMSATAFPRTSAACGQPSAYAPRGPLARGFGCLTLGPPPETVCSVLVPSPSAVCTVWGRGVSRQELFGFGLRYGSAVRCTTTGLGLALLCVFVASCLPVAVPPMRLGLHVLAGHPSTQLGFETLDRR